MAAEWRVELTFAERIAATSKMHVIIPFHLDNAKQSSEYTETVLTALSVLLRISEHIQTVTLQKRRNMRKHLKMTPGNMRRPLCAMLYPLFTLAVR
jgi:hypothetical protein